MQLDYNNVEANYDEIICVLTDIASECDIFERFEYRIKEDYMDGLTTRLYKRVALQYGKEYLSQIGEDYPQWVSFIDYLLDNSNFLNKGLKTRNRKNFDRKAFWVHIKTKGR